MVILLLIVMGVGYLIFQVQWVRIRNTYQSNIKDYAISVSAQAQVAVTNNEPINLLVMGYDYQSVANRFQLTNDLNQTVLIHPEEQATLEIKYSPNLQVTTAEDDAVQLNHLLADYGFSGTIEEFENLLDSPIDFFLAVNFNSLAPLIDELDGITITPTFNVVLQDRELLENNAYVLSGAEIDQFLLRTTNQSTSEHVLRQELVLNGLFESLSQKINYLNAIPIIEASNNSLSSNLPVEYWRSSLGSSYQFNQFDRSTETFNGIANVENNVTYEIIDESRQENIQNHVKSFLQD